MVRPKARVMTNLVAGHKVLKFSSDDGVSHVVFRVAFTMLSEALANHANRDIAIHSQIPILAIKVYNFIRMHPLEFHGFKVDEDPIEFINEDY